MLSDDTGSVDVVRDGQISSDEVPALLALNQDLRSEYTGDCNSGLKRWNKLLADAGVDYRLSLPHVGFNRQVGAFSQHNITPEGRIVSAEEWEAKRDTWLPTEVDKAHVRSLMHPVLEPGKIAGWIAPPSRGINGQPFDYEYVHFN